MEQPPPSPKKQRRKPGPKGPHKFKPERASKLIRLIRSGISKSHAAELVGITTECIRVWSNRGKADAESGETNAYTRFFVDLRHARACAYTPHEKAIAEFAAFKPWRRGKGKKEKLVSQADERRGRLMERKARMALAVLRVRDPAWKDPVQRHEHAGPGGAPLAASPTPAADFSALNGDEYRRYVELSATARQAFETMTPAEVAELQGLLRKARMERASEESDDAERR